MADLVSNKPLDYLEAVMEDNEGFNKFMSSSTLNSCSQSMPCIRRVPDPIRQLKESAYIPSIVSIGPLHRKPKPKKAQWIKKEEKAFYTRFLFERTRAAIAEDTGADIDIFKIKEKCMAAILDEEERARKCYTEEDTKRLEDKSFAEMMVIDGCFTIELLYRHSRREFDPILVDDSKRNLVRNDLILLQNQIPFFVLYKLFHLTVDRITLHDKESDHPSLTKCVLGFLDNRMGSVIDKQERASQETERKAKEFLHIVHLLHFHHVHSQAMECSVSISSKEAGQSQSEKAGQSKSDGCKSATQLDSNGLKLEVSSTGCLFDVKFTTPCCRLSQLWKCCGLKGQSQSEGCKSATQLDSNGLKLEASSTGYLFDVKFTTPCCCLSQLWKRCGLKIPSFIIDDSTETFLRNMIAFEQCWLDKERYFTSHAILMDQLINSPEDVKLLEDAGIIRTNYLGCRDGIDRLFNSICKNVHLGAHGSIFHKQCEKVKTYCHRCWPRRRQKLSRDYRSSPWAMISIFAALVLFVLTLLQTIYTMLSYY